MAGIYQYYFLFVVNIFLLNICLGRKKLKLFSIVKMKVCFNVNKHENFFHSLFDKLNYFLLKKTLYLDTVLFFNLYYPSKKLLILNRNKFLLRL